MRELTDCSLSIHKCANSFHRSHERLLDFSRFHSPARYLRWGFLDRRVMEGRRIRLLGKMKHVDLAEEVDKVLSFSFTPQKSGLYTPLFHHKATANCFSVCLCVNVCLCVRVCVPVCVCVKLNTPAVGKNELLMSPFVFHTNSFDRPDCSRATRELSLFQ